MRRYKKKILPALGHVWDEGRVESSPGIFHTGTRVITCENNCGATQETPLYPRILTEGVWYIAAAAVLAWGIVLGMLIYPRLKEKRIFSGKRQRILDLPADSAEKGV